ncbi:MAG: hypothetical protein U0175_22615 [Caldilineaceae bacterium]
MTEMHPSTLEDFLAAPTEEIAVVAPATMIYAPGGTRRQAVFNGIEPWSEEYMAWALDRMIGCSTIIFEHGVKHLFTPLFISTNFKEVNRHRDNVFRGIHKFLTNNHILSEYERLGWRVRLIGAESVPELSETAEKLRASTLSESSRTLYWLVVPDPEEIWQQLFTIVHNSHARTRKEAVCAMYGEEIPPATLYLAFGKPMVSLEIIPPLLLGELQCYWSQQPGYTLTEKMFRTILFDYAYLRRTWQVEKLERAKDALAYQKEWEQELTLGLGMRLGLFWYPAPMTSPAWSKEQDMIAISESSLFKQLFHEIC